MTEGGGACSWLLEVEGAAGEERLVGLLVDVAVGVEYGAAPPMLDVSADPSTLDGEGPLAPLEEGIPDVTDTPVLLEYPNKGVPKLYRSLVGVKPPPPLDEDAPFRDVYVARDVAVVFETKYVGSVTKEAGP